MYKCYRTCGEPNLKSLINVIPPKKEMYANHVIKEFEAKNPNLFITIFFKTLTPNNIQKSQPLKPFFSWRVFLANSASKSY